MKTLRTIFILSLAVHGLGLRAHAEEDDPHLDLPFEDPQEEADYQDWADGLLEGAGIGAPDLEPSPVDERPGEPLVIPQEARAPEVPPLFRVAQAEFQEWRAAQTAVPSEPTPQTARTLASVPVTETEALTQNALSQEDEFQAMVMEGSLASPTYQKILDALRNSR